MKLNKGLLVLLVSIITLSFAPMKTSSAAGDERPFLELSRPDRGKVFAIAWSPDGQYIAVGTEQGLWIYTDTFADVTHADDKPIHALAWSPDGETIAAGYFGKEAETRVIPDYPMHSIEDGGLRLWSVHRADGNVRLAASNVLLHVGSVYCVRFNPDGSRLAVLVETAHDLEESALGVDKLQIWSTNSGRLLNEANAKRTFMLQSDRLTQGANGLDWSDNNRLAVIRNLSQAKIPQFSILDSDHNQVVMRSGDLDKYESVGTVTAIGWNDDQTKLAISSTASEDPMTWGGIDVCNSDGTECSKPPLMYTGGVIEESGNVETLVWRPHASLLAYSEGTIIHLWDATTKQLIADLDAAHSMVTMLAWKPDGSKLLSAGSDYIVRLWTHFSTYQLPDPQPFKIITLPLQHAQGVVSPNGKWIADAQSANNKSHQVSVSSLKDGGTQASFTVKDITQHIYLSWSPNSDMLVILFQSDDFGCNGVVLDSAQVWSTDAGKILLNLELVNDWAWRPDGRAIAVVRYPEYGKAVLEIYEVSSRKRLQVSPPSNEWGERFRFLQPTVYFDHDLGLSGWSPDSQLVAVDDSVDCGSYEPTSIKLWNPQTNAIVGELPAPRSIYGGSGGYAYSMWSPDSKLIAVSGFDDDFLYRLTSQDNRIVPELIWQPAWTRSQWRGHDIFSPDSRYFVYRGTVLDTWTQWPTFMFRNTMLEYDDYRWEGDTFIAVKRANETTKGTEVYVRTSDFLPQ